MSKARLAVAEAEDDQSILQQEMKGLASQIDAHHREDDARRERSQGGMMVWRVFLLRRRMMVWQEEEGWQGSVWRWFEFRKGN